MTVCGIAVVFIVDEAVIDNKLIRFAECTTRDDTDASTRLANYLLLINGPTAIPAGLLSPRGLDGWVVPSPRGDTRINARGLQVGNQTNSAYDHASRSITSSVYGEDRLCIVGI